MILRRLGNKKKMANNLFAHFPEHDLYIEPFFGAGGMFFNKPKAKYNIVNDNDSDIFNLFKVLNNDWQALELAIFSMPINEELFQYWRKNKESDPIKKAVRFLFLSNFSFMGKGGTMCFGAENTKKILLQNVQKTHEFMANVLSINQDFRKMFKKISFKDSGKHRAFIYCDPPYLGTVNNYQSGFNQQDSADLFETLISTGVRFAMSEFDHPFIIEQATRHGLNIIEIGERKNLKNRRMEILITNYQS